ncbi:CRISPR-associated protein Cas5 [Arsenicicoccus dermatophilus]|uniref:CRISPR-associated protein Cas5 n=1 Tax=Arsenicicoccus dermatophilus TaxID=1076331 RepID=UPI001F4CB140|nr:CRISPR-associated protein Cas5 [Arsenicicoccus dermatophilus]MCH8611569.1 CRISPR-associated protein Cas5 [Arsenicicoccus dermatophilus]
MRHVIRLAAPIQSWAGYSASHRTVRTLPLPTASGVAGLLGACLGVSDHLTLLDRFTLHVRVDRTNPAEVDLQVAVPPPPGRATEVWHRSVALHEVTSAVRRGDKVKPYRVKDINLTGGTNKVQFSEGRTFLPHAEFLCVVDALDDELDERLQEGFRRPTFMPYLGRMANGPSYPFHLGRGPQDVGDLMSQIPLVAMDGHPTPERLRVYEATGGHAAPRHRECGLVSPPTAARRAEQLAWAKEHLTR